MNKIFAVLRREFLERVRSRAFLVATILMPVLMVALIGGQVAMMQGGNRTQSLAVVDATTDGLGSEVTQGLEALRFDNGAGDVRYHLTHVDAAGRLEAVRDSLIALTGFSRKVRPESFDGVLVLTDSTYTSGAATFYGTGGIKAIQDLQGTLSGVLTRTRLARNGVDMAVLAKAMSGARISNNKVSDGQLTGESGGASLALAYGMGFILYMAILLMGQQTASSVIEEKTSRIMEILASSMTPFQMLVGKIVGVGLSGLLQLGIWGGTFFLLSNQRVRLAGLVGISADKVASIPIPSMPLDLLIIFLTFFALGFFMYGALYAMVGSLVNSMQEIQQFILPVTLPVIFGFFGMISVINDPQSTIGLAFSYIPFFAPFVMPVRWAMSSVPVSELVLSIALMILGVLAVAWLAGRIYRTGILMYGKKPTLREVFRWVRAG
jgi:ABC-2 type transport system permease protein